ncbi:chemotaxis protein CheB, partial [Serratia marcescens]|uniref:chemotaxis protein CheB n=1 Tax=Serratia marcescens TaxID=615 RepID=UPI0023B79F38
SGLLDMRRAGAATIGQDEATCVVYGMPKAAADCGAVQTELPLSKIPARALDICQSMSARGVRV